MTTFREFFEEEEIEEMLSQEHLWAIEFQFDNIMSRDGLFKTEEEAIAYIEEKELDAIAVPMVIR